MPYGFCVWREPVNGSNGIRACGDRGFESGEASTQQNDNRGMTMIAGPGVSSRPSVSLLLTLSRSNPLDVSYLQKAVLSLEETVRSFEIIVLHDSCEVNPTFERFILSDDRLRLKKRREAGGYRLLLEEGTVWAKGVVILTLDTAREPSPSAIRSLLSPVKQGNDIVSLASLGCEHDHNGRGGGLRVASQAYRRYALMSLFEGGSVREIREGVRCALVPATQTN